MGTSLGRGEYFRRWADLHGGYQPAAHRPARLWLTLVYGVARLLPGVPPLAVTAAGLLVALAVPALAAAGWVLAAALAVVASGFLDSLDGAVALGAGRDSRLGYVLDSVADRVADTSYVLALWVLGAPGWICTTAAVGSALQEYVRARAAGVGLTAIAVVSVNERPTRILLAVAGTAGILAATTAPTIAAAAGVVLAAVGVVQVTLAVRRGLR